MKRYLEYCRRNNYYVDHMIQKWLLVALVALEMLSIATAVWALYSALEGVVEANTYRIHFHEDSNALPAFFIVGLKIIVGIGIMNFAAIVAADRIWAIYVNRILRNLDRIVVSARHFDFSAMEVERQEHAMLDRAVHWRDDEAARLRQIRESLRSLPGQLPDTSDQGAHALLMLRTIEEQARRDR